MSDLDDPKLLANKIRVTSLAHFDSLLNNSYEISKINWRSIDGSDRLSIVPTLLLEKGNDKLLADAGQISDYVIQLQPLYDVNKKKNGFVWVPNTALYFDLELKFTDHSYSIPSTLSIFKAIMYFRNLMQRIHWI